MKHAVPVSLTVVALFAFSFSGCSSDSTEPTASDTTSTDDGHGDDDHGDDDHGDHAQHDEGGQTDMEKMMVELAKLSPEDAASAEKQHFCPVKDSMLGTMGPPHKIDVNGQQVWICCEECKDELLEKPDEYLAKLKN